MQYIVPEQLLEIIIIIYDSRGFIQINRLQYVKPNNCAIKETFRAKKYHNPLL